MQAEKGSGFTKKRWSHVEIAKLTKLAADGVSAPEAASILLRSAGAVQQKAMELGITLVRVEKTSWWQGWPARSSPLGDRQPSAVRK